MPAPVFVIGSVNMDLLFTEVDRIPAPGETVSGGSFQIAPGGKGANQAAAASRLGAPAIFVARVGHDEFADRALDDLRSAGVDLSLVKRVQAATGVAAVLVDREHENAIVIAPGANAELGPESVNSVPDVADAVVLAYLEIPLETVIAWAKLARERGWRFVLNPAPARPLLDLGTDPQPARAVGDWADG